jgi:HD-GYP domain-containing protein (c-di-GMP phosphodiesterase class II)
VLLKPGKLTPAERLEIQRHPVAGRDLLKNMRTLETAMPIVYHHHERYDGSGYPEGPQGRLDPAARPGRLDRRRLRRADDQAARTATP